MHLPSILPRAPVAPPRESPSLFTERGSHRSAASPIPGAEGEEITWRWGQRQNKRPIFEGMERLRRARLDPSGSAAISGDGRRHPHPRKLDQRLLPGASPGCDPMGDASPIPQRGEKFMHRNRGTTVKRGFNPPVPRMKSFLRLGSPHGTIPVASPGPAKPPSLGSHHLPTPCYLKW